MRSGALSRPSERQASPPRSPAWRLLSGFRSSCPSPRTGPSPAHGLINAACVFLQDHTPILRGRDIPGCSQVRDGVIGEIVEVDQLGPCELLCETPAHACAPETYARCQTCQECAAFCNGVRPVHSDVA